MSNRLAVSGSNLTGDVPFSAALSMGSGTFCVCSPQGERGDLTRLCQTLCQQHDLRPEDIDEVFVDVGPGSYTGLRVAATFVRFLQTFGEIQVQAIDSLALLAHFACGDAAAGTRVRPMLDARRGRYHTARYELQDGRLVELEAPSASATEEVMARLEPGERVVVPAAFAEALADDLDKHGLEVVVARDLGADRMFAAGLPTFPAKPEDLEPRYLMASYAED